MLATPRKMTDEQVKQYWEDGYISFGDIVPHEDLMQFRDYVDDLVQCLAPGVRPENMNLPHVVDRHMLEFCARPYFLDVVEQIVGPNIVLFAAGLFCKPKGDGKEVPWHQDGIFWPLEPMKVATLWLAVDDATVENGCMRVIPGTHKLGPINHQGATEGKALHLELDEKLFDPTKSVNLDMPMGSCSFHEPYTIHGSNPNFSEKRRCGLTIRYMAAESKFDPNDPNWPDPDYPLYLLRGKDVGNGNVYQPIESVPYRARGTQWKPPF